MKWTWEYYDGAYIVRRIDMTMQVAFKAPRTPGNNAAASGFCDFYDALEADNTRLRKVLKLGLAMIERMDPDTTIGVEDAMRVMRFRNTARAALEPKP